MNQIIPASQSNSNYVRVAQALASRLGITPDQFVQSYKFYDDELYLPKALSVSQTRYDFNPVRGLDSLLPTAILMDKSDLFAVTAVGLVFTRATYASATETLSAYGDYPPYTYPYVSVFTGTKEQDGLLNIVNGTVALSVNADQQFSIPARRMVYSDEYINAQVSTIKYGGASNGEQGLLDLNQIVVMDGENQNTISVNLSDGGTLTNINGNTNGTLRNILAVRLTGFRVRNMAGGFPNGQNFTSSNCRV